MASSTTVAGTGPASAASAATGLGRGTGPTASAASRSAAHPPETLEGWYAVHQVFRVRRDHLRSLPAEARRRMAEHAIGALQRLAGGSQPAGVGRVSADHPGAVAPRPALGGASGADEPAGWTIAAALTGSVADVMVVHFRPTLDEVGAAQRELASESLFDHLEPVTSFLSVTEAGLYHITAAVAAARSAAGGVVGDAEYQAMLAERSSAERASPQVQRRLYPPLPADMPYLCFYPMSKRRAVGQNWYALTLEERSRLMQTHGQTGRRYAGRVQQVITGAIGLDAWEWGVTLFAGDPLDFKRLVTDMRFDEVSAQYAEFGAFYVGRILTPAAWVSGIVGAE